MRGFGQGETYKGDNQENECRENPEFLRTPERFIERVVHESSFKKKSERMPSFSYFSDIL
jgi:hypothetical protein